MAPLISALNHSWFLCFIGSSVQGGRPEGSSGAFLLRAVV